MRDVRRGNATIHETLQAKQYKYSIAASDRRRTGLPALETICRLPSRQTPLDAYRGIFTGDNRPFTKLGGEAHSINSAS